MKHFPRIRSELNLWKNDQKNLIKKQEKINKKTENLKTERDVLESKQNEIN